MQPGIVQDLKIYRVLVFRRGQDIGSLKIIANNESRAFKIARSVLNDNPQLNSYQITFRGLELGSVAYQGQTERLLSREGV